MMDLKNVFSGIKKICNTLNPEFPATDNKWAATKEYDKTSYTLL